MTSGQRTSHQTFEIKKEGLGYKFFAKMIRIASDGELLAQQASRDVFCCDNEFNRRFTQQGHQFRRVEGSTKVWKRFAILPNIDGQKFTIGNNFTSVEEQGELISWNKDFKEIKDDTEPSSMCQIEVHKKKFWVTPLEENVIYLNDNKIEMRTELKFGDYLTLGKPEDCQKVSFDEWRPYPNVLWFNKRDLNPVIVNICGKPKEDGQKQGSSTKTLELMDLDEEQAKVVGGQIPTALSLILSYLPVKSLPTSRLVSKHWNDEAVKIMKKKCHIHFRFGEENGYTRTNQSMRFFLYNLEMDQSPVQNWAMELPNIWTKWQLTGLDTSSGRPGAKFLSDLETFLSRPHDSIRRLVLDGEIHRRSDFDIQVKVLQHLASGLEDLNLDWNWNLDNPSKEICLMPTFNFNKLQRYTSTFVNDEEWDELHPESSWLQPLIPAISGVKSLRLFFYGYSSTGDEACPAIFLKQINSFPNLQELTLLEVAPSHIQLLLNLGKPLKTLKLIQLMDMEAVDVPDFEKLLRKHSSTLESLHFVLPEFYKRTEIRIPIMPKLKRLNIGLVGDYEDDPIQIKLIFSGGVINYAKDFPSLESLKVWPWTEDECEWKCMKDYHLPDINLLWDDYSAFFQLFFPNPSQQGCKTLRNLDILYEDCAKNVFPRASQVAALFPNVHNKWMNKAREMMPRNVMDEEEPISICVNLTTMCNNCTDDIINIINQVNDNVCQCDSPRPRL